MLKVEHLRNLASTCRNMARQIPGERAAELRALARSYEERAEERLEMLRSGAPIALTSHPSEPEAQAF